MIVSSFSRFAGAITGDVLYQREGAGESEILWKLMNIMNGLYGPLVVQSKRNQPVQKKMLPYNWQVT